MPPFPGAATIVQDKTVTASFYTAGRENASTGLDRVPTDATDAQIATMVTTWANLSNAALIKRTNSTTAQISQTAAVAYDEAFASAGTKLVLVFQNAQLDTRQISIPAPDLSYFLADGVTADETNAAVDAAVQATLTVLNAGTPAGTYAYLRGFRSEQTRKLRRAVSNINIVEPGVGATPPDAPAT